MRHLAIFAATAAILFSTSAYSGTPHDLVVEGTPTLSQWSSRISRALDENLEYPGLIGRQAPTGVVSVTFNCSDAGLPANAAVVERSNYGSLNRAALRAIRNMKSMHPLPDGIQPGQVFRADLYFAETQGDLDQLKARVANRERMAANTAASGSKVIRLAVRAQR